MRTINPAPAEEPDYYTKIAEVTGVNRDVVKRVILAGQYIPKEEPQIRFEYYVHHGEVDDMVENLLRSKKMGRGYR